MDIQPETQGSKDVFKGRASSIKVHGPHVMVIILKPLLLLPTSSPNPTTWKIKAMMHHLLQTWPIFQVLSSSGSVGQELEDLVFWKMFFPGSISLPRMPGSPVSPSSLVSPPNPCGDVQFMRLSPSYTQLKQLQLLRNTSKQNINNW